MFGTQHYWLFLVSGILLNITPGQDTVYIVGRSLAQGRRAGLLSVLGIVTGAMIHTLAAAFGLSAILATSATAFTTVKLAGAAYLVYLGIRLWLDRSETTDPESKRGPEGSWAIFRAGFLTDLLNPKVALFYLAFLPQFVDPQAPSKLIAFLFLGASFLTTGTIWCTFLALAASAIGTRLKASSGLSTLFHRLTGTAFVGLGLRLAFAK